MKRLIFIAALTLCLLACLSASGCGGNNSVHVTEPTVPVTHTTASPTDSAVESLYDCPPNDPTLRVNPKEYTFSFDGEETLLCSSELYAVYVTSVQLNEETGSWEAAFRFANTSDLTLYFSCNGLAVNNWVFDTFLSVSAAPGETVSSVLPFGSFMPIPAVPHADKVSLLLKITPDDYRNCIVGEGLYTLYLSGSDESTVAVPERKTSSRDVVLADCDRFMLVLLVDDMYKEMEYGPAKLTFYAENRTGDFVDIGFENFAINRWSLDPVFYYAMMPGTRGYFTVTADPQRAAECGIEEYEEICFDLEVMSVYEYPRRWLETSCTAYPTGLVPDEISAPVREAHEGQRIITDSEDLTVILEPVSDGWDKSPFFRVYTVNRTGSVVCVVLNGFRVNGEEDEPISFFDTIRPGMSCLTEAFLKRYDTDSLNALECNVTVYAADNEEQVLFRESITVLP